MTTFKIRRKNDWLAIFEINGTIDGNCSSQRVFCLDADVIMTFSFVKRSCKMPFDAPDDDGIVLYDNAWLSLLLVSVVYEGIGVAAVVPVS